MNTTQQQIEFLLRSTGDKRIIAMLPTLAHSTFYTVGCHSHHRFRGGLAQHSLGVTQLLLSQENLVQQYGRTNVIIAGMFHDICTAKNWLTIGSGQHGRRSVRILGERFRMYLDSDVYSAIKYHMHHWHGNGGQESNPLHAALRHADHQNAATA